MTIAPMSLPVALRSRMASVSCSVVIRPKRRSRPSSGSPAGASGSAGGAGAGAGATSSAGRSGCGGVDIGAWAEARGEGGLSGGSVT